MELTLRDQRVEDAVFRAILGLRFHLRFCLIAHHLHGRIGQIAHDLLDILADVADFRELGRLDLDERRVGQIRETPRDFGFADAGRTDHEDIFRRHFIAQRRFELHAPPAIAQRDRDRALGRVLADDVAIEFGNDFARRQFGHVTFRRSENFRTRNERGVYVIQPHHSSSIDTL